MSIARLFTVGLLLAGQWAHGADAPPNILLLVAEDLSPRIGSYGEQCGNAGYVSVHFVNVVGHQALVSPFGGRERRTKQTSKQDRGDEGGPASRAGCYWHSKIPPEPTVGHGLRRSTVHSFRAPGE